VVSDTAGHPGLSESGALSVPLALLLSATLAFGIGGWSLLHRWRVLAEVQLRLDRCTGQAAQDLKRAFERVQRLNQAIRAARATLAAGILVPEAAAAAREALQAAYAAQELVMAAWRAKQGYWLLRRGCGKSGDIASPLPSLPWTRDLPDVLGPKPVRWSGSSSTFLIQAANGPRRAAAKVLPTEGELDEETEPRRWSLEWSAYK
jgi:hypothetical protein